MSALEGWFRDIGAGIPPQRFRSARGDPAGEDGPAAVQSNILRRLRPDACRFEPGASTCRLKPFPIVTVE